MIDGVQIKELKVHKDGRGFLMEILRCSDGIKADGKAFGQYYVMTVLPKAIKGKHLHKLQTDHMCCIRGRAFLHLEDERPSSPTRGMKQVIEFGEGAWKVVRLPPGVWHSIENAADEEAYVINYVTREYDREKPDEYRGQFDLRDKKMAGKPIAIG